MIRWFAIYGFCYELDGWLRMCLSVKTHPATWRIPIISLLVNCLFFQRPVLRHAFQFSGTGHRECVAFRYVFIIFPNKPGLSDRAGFPVEASYRKMTLKWHLFVASAPIRKYVVCWYIAVYIRTVFLRLKTPPLSLLFSRRAVFPVLSVEKPLRCSRSTGFLPSRGRAVIPGGQSRSPRLLPYLF